MKSLTGFQVKQKQAVQERARQAVASEREGLLNDPSSPSAGNPKGVTVVEFFDYRCGYCKKVSSTVAKLLETNPEQPPILLARSSIDRWAYLRFCQVAEHVV